MTCFEFSVLGKTCPVLCISAFRLFFIAASFTCQTQCTKHKLNFGVRISLFELLSTMC